MVIHKMTKTNKPKIVTNAITGEKYYNKTGKTIIDPIKRFKIFKISLEIELKEEFQKSSVEDIYNIIKDDIGKYAFKWRIPVAFIKQGDFNEF